MVRESGERGHGISDYMIFRIKIPTATATPIIGAQAPFRILYDVNGSRKSKMAANTLEILISQLQDKIATPFQRLSTHCLGPESQRHYSEHCSI